MSSGVFLALTIVMSPWNRKKYKWFFYHLYPSGIFFVSMAYTDTTKSISLFWRSECAQNQNRNFLSNLAQG